MNNNDPGLGPDPDPEEVAAAAAAAEVNQEEIEKCSHFNRLPDDILLHIFNKLLDLKCLCFCSLVSKRFTSLVPLVHSVSFTVPRRRPPLQPPFPDNPIPDNTNLSKKFFRFLINGVVSKPLRFLRQIVAPKPLPRSLSSFYGDSFRSAVYFLSKFKQIRYLQMEIPSYSHGGDDEDSLIYKWRAKFGIKLETFVFISPTSIRKQDNRQEHGHEEEEEESQSTSDFLKHRVHLAFHCLKDAIVRHRMLLFLIEQHQMLESVAITDSKKQGRLFVRDGDVVVLRNRMDSASETLGPQLKNIEVPVTASQWYVPVLDLPVSGCVMDGATLVVMGMVDGIGGESGVGIVGDFKEGEEAFGEAVMEMMLNHKSRMKTLL